jgi:dTDP-4-amino-4,6-dideoxygalactose transaminase
VYKKLYGYQVGDYPLSEEFSRKCLSIPIHPFLDDDDLKQIAEDIRAFYNK